MATPRQASLKVVAHLRDETVIKGYTDDVSIGEIDSLVQQGPASLPEMITVRCKDGQQILLRQDSFKALFFVRSFEGDKEYKEAKFFESTPEIAGIWVKVTFYDGEFTEGVVRNSLTLLVSPGFFLKPPDPQANNKMIYVRKDSLADFRVLGLAGDF